MVVGGADAEDCVTHGMAPTAPLPTRLGLTMGLGRAEEEEEEEEEYVGTAAAAPQAEAAAERPERAVEDFNFRTRLAVVEVDADWEEAPAMGG